MKCKICGKEKPETEFTIRQRYWAIEDQGKPGCKPRIYRHKICKSCRSVIELKRWRDKKNVQDE